MNTVVIKIQGIAIPNDSSDSDGRAGAGIFFGKAAKNNSYALVRSNMSQTQNRALMEAVKIALSEIIRIRQTFLDPRWKEIMIMTNSEYIVKTFSEWVWLWERDGWRRTNGSALKNLDIVQNCHKLLCEIENDRNMAVRFWKVDRMDITEAAGLARQALDLDCV